ncbi:MAG TPA: DUF4397 domain-containing protein [Terriglobales bacterium]|jgi:hypothetical protein|nr:DUF4397 domain-containing protein [Terriglobales bacterium]
MFCSRSLTARALIIRTLAVAALSIVTISCNQTNLTEVRVINAISDGPGLDVYLNGSKSFTDMPFLQVNPTPPAYSSFYSGEDTFEAFKSGTTTNPLYGYNGIGNSGQGTGGAIINLNGSTQYTVIMDGLYAGPSLAVIRDNNAVPFENQEEFRVINASPGSPTVGVDVYIVPPSTEDLTNYTPQISGLENGQGSIYQNLAYVSSGYAVMVTANGSKKALITVPLTPQAQSITTVVLVDNLGGLNGMSQTPLILHDLN